MNRSLTIKAGQCHVQKYLQPLLERIQKREIDPSFAITHRMRLDDAPEGFANSWRRTTTVSRSSRSRIETARAEVCASLSALAAAQFLLLNT
jgi:hypothetical protein